MSAILEDGKVPQQRDYADDDDYGAYDLLGAASIGSRFRL